MSAALSNRFAFDGKVLERVLLAIIEAAIFAGLVLWSIWTDSIKPRLVPRADIDREADVIIADYADPEGEAFARHERAWYRSEGAEQVYWYRVRKAVRGRLKAGR